MIAAIIGGAGAVVVVAIAMAVLASKWNDAELRCADARVDATTKAGQLAIGASDIATARRDAADEKARADALDDVLDEVATTGDAAGARSRVLSRWSRETPAAGTNPDAAGGGAAHVMPGPDKGRETESAIVGDRLLRPDGV